MDENEKDVDSFLQELASEAHQRALESLLRESTLTMCHKAVTLSGMNTVEKVRTYLGPGDLAAHFGVSRQCVYDWLRASKLPPPDIDKPGRKLWELDNLLRWEAQPHNLETLGIRADSIAIIAVVSEVPATMQPIPRDLAGEEVAGRMKVVDALVACAGALAAIVRVVEANRRPSRLDVLALNEKLLSVSASLREACIDAVAGEAADR